MSKRARRYIPSGALEGDARWRPFPSKHCQWCNKPLPPRYRTFCPPEDRRVSPTNPRTYKYQACAIAYSWYWYTTPRFRRLILLRDNFTCQKCGLHPTVVWDDGVERPDLHLLHVDHIVPYSRGGLDHPENLQLLCASCNLSKGAKEEIDDSTFSTRTVA